MEFGNMTLHTGGTTLSGHITRDLIYHLNQGIYKDIKILPSEIELSKKHKVSRSVIRDALSNLEREGLVARYRGIGTVVLRDVVNLRNRIDLKIEYNDIIESLGGVPTSDNVTLDESEANEERAEKLDIPVGSPVLIREKRLLADGVPVLYSIDTISTAFFQGKEYRDLNWGGPIFDVLEGAFGVSIDLDIADFRPVNPNGRMQVMLGVSENAPLLRVEEIGYYKENIPVLHTIAYYTDYFSFTVLRKRF